jgi:hypothetical protein
MRPLKLNVEELKIESFQTGLAAARTGTVQGQAVAASVIAAYATTCGGATASPTLCDSCDSCDWSCWGSCGASCNGCLTSVCA